MSLLANNFWCSKKIFFVFVLFFSLSNLNLSTLYKREIFRIFLDVTVLPDEMFCVFLNSCCRSCAWHTGLTFLVMSGHHSWVFLKVGIKSLLLRLNWTTATAAYSESLSMKWLLHGQVISSFQTTPGISWGNQLHVYDVLPVYYFILLSAEAPKGLTCISFLLTILPLNKT